MCDGSDPRWLVWGQWQAPLPQFSFLLDSVDHLTIHSFGANAKAIGTIGMIHDASGSLTSNYDAQSLRFALEALSLSLRAQMRSSMSLEVGKAVAEQRSQVLKQVQDDSYARTCFTGRLLWGPQQCRWKRVLWFIWSLSKDVQSYCFATYSNLFVAKPEVFLVLEMSLPLIFDSIFHLCKGFIIDHYCMAVWHFGIFRPPMTDRLDSRMRQGSCSGFSSFAGRVRCIGFTAGSPRVSILHQIILDLWWQDTVQIIMT